MTNILIKNDVPYTFGVYIIYKNEKIHENIIYIGKASEYFKDLFDGNIKKIMIVYYETSKSFIPFFVESSLIQKYFQTFNKLTILNKAY